MLFCLIGYLYLSYKAEKSQKNQDALHAREAEEVGGVPKRPGVAVAFLILGLLGIVIGAKLLVNGGLGIAAANPKATICAGSRIPLESATAAGDLTPVRPFSILVGLRCRRRPSDMPGDRN